ncbi:MAG TPA: DMT family transporter, partial [Gemmatales bacterium]|nr:DMT family transporter [Gemmatales bacterium]
LNLYKLLVALVGFSAITLILQGLHLLGWVGEAPHFPQSWEKSGWLMLSGLIGLTLGDTLFFFSIRYLEAALTAVIQCLTPPLNALIDWMVLKVPMTSIQVLGLFIIVLSVAGVVLAQAPRQQTVQSHYWVLGLLAAIGSAVASAVGFAITGYHVQNESIFTCNILRVAPSLLVLVLFALSTRSGRAGVRYLFSKPGKLLWLA